MVQLVDRMEPRVGDPRGDGARQSPPRRDAQHVAPNREVGLPTRMVRLGRARDEFGDAMVERMGYWLRQRDPLADALIEQTRHWSRRRLMSAIEQALTQGLDGLEEVPPALEALLEQLQTIPVWVDPAQIARGGTYFLQTNILGGIVLGARSLISGYKAPAGNKPLVMTGRLQRSVHRRLAETSRFVYEVSEPGGMSWGQAGFVTTVKVRLMHAHVRQMILERPGWEPGWGAPINQHDMAATVLLFSLTLIEGLERLGLAPRPEQVRDYLALWRYVGHVLGVEQELLTSRREEAERLRDFIDLTQAPPDEDARALTRAFLRAGIDAAADEESRQRALRGQSFHHAIVRHLLGEPLADDLGVPPSPLELVFPLLRPVIGQLEALFRLPGGPERALEAGQRYWRWALENNPAGMPTELTMPEELIARPWRAPRP